MIDLDLSRAMFDFAQGIEVSDDALAVDLINEIEFGEKGTYLESEHTLKHFRDVQWDTRFFDRTYREEESLTPTEADERLLKQADEAWRELVAAQPPTEVEPSSAAELDRIVEGARRDLLA